VGQPVEQRGGHLGVAGGAERQIAELVEDHEVGAREALGELPGLSLGLFLFERVDELDGGEEADLLSMMLDSLDPERRGDMIVYR